MSDLHPVAHKFILHWGEMGARWGINRTVAQIHALLLVSRGPLHAEQIAGTLQVSRSNVSTSLRELLAWGIVRTAQKLGDRRDYYEAVGDVWDMARIIARERKRREFDPTLVALRECVQELEARPADDALDATRLAELLEFLETLSDLYGQLDKVPSPALKRFARLGSKIPRIIGSL
jgi:DNA-binding transcriptional regulator GbsR (MarR family)